MGATTNGSHYKWEPPQMGATTNGSRYKWEPPQMGATITVTKKAQIQKIRIKQQQ